MWWTRIRGWVLGVLVLILLLALAPLIFFRPSQEPASKYVIVVFKADRRVEILENGRIVRSFPVALSAVSVGPKEQLNDFRTPEGVYWICKITGSTPRDLFYLISYPSLADAASAFRHGKYPLWDLVGTARLLYANVFHKIPPQTTMLGGAIGFHGGDVQGDWTAGCPGLTYENLAIFSQYVQLGTPVYILP